MSDLEIRRMREEDIDGAIETIWAAFSEDPYSKWIFSTPQSGSARNRQSLTLRCQWGIEHGLFFVCRSKSQNKVLGTAMWLAPHQAKEPETWSEYLGGWRLWFGQVLMNLYHGRGGLNVKRYYVWKAAQAEAQSELWTDERGYYFCNIVTVLPEAQGKGVGKLLMQVVLDEADSKNMRCYLESSRKEPNIAIYEKFGFELKREMLCDDDGMGIMLYCMIREPKGAK